MNKSSDFLCNMENIDELYIILEKLKWIKAMTEIMITASVMNVHRHV